MRSSPSLASAFASGFAGSSFHGYGAVKAFFIGLKKKFRFLHGYFKPVGESL